MDLRKTLDHLQSGVLLLRPLKESVIELSGEDAKDWLQGQITQDIQLLTKGGHIAACICSPTGQLLAIVHVYERSGKILLVTQNPEVVLNLVKDFVIMEDVSAKILATEIVSVQGASAVSGGDNWLLRDRAGFGGFDVFAPSDEILDIVQLNPEHLEALEIAAGIPKLGADTTTKTLPPELGPQFDSQHIHYQKGCYAGQEVLQRIHSRGHTNKTWVGLRSDQLLATGDQVLFDDQIVGTVLRSAEHPQLGFIATATLKNSAAEPNTKVQVGSATAVVQHFPLTRMK